LALLGREGLWGMIGVEKIGEIRRAYFEQHRSIKEKNGAESNGDKGPRFSPTISFLPYNMKSGARPQHPSVSADAPTALP
jgi:hypothetical protein